ncbi:MAG: hypothetical protein LBG70_03045 [Bifidobacteriaceae bacterium]|jgi:hypothetical protein|nr:hypothetical protein [Bifidobacteriaceae bacterium]
MRSWRRTGGASLIVLLPTLVVWGQTATVSARTPWLESSLLDSALVLLLVLIAQFVWALGWPSAVAVNQPQLARVLLVLTGWLSTVVVVCLHDAAWTVAVLAVSVPVVFARECWGQVGQTRPLESIVALQGGLCAVAALALWPSLASSGCAGSGLASGAGLAGLLVGRVTLGSDRRGTGGMGALLGVGATALAGGVGGVAGAWLGYLADGTVSLPVVIAASAGVLAGLAVAVVVPPLGLFDTAPWRMVDSVRLVTPLVVVGVPAFLAVLVAAPRGF